MRDRFRVRAASRVAACLWLASLGAGAAHAAPLAVGDLLMSCGYWGITRIEAATGEQHPIGVGGGGSYGTLAEDAAGLVWIIDNRWVVSIDPATGEHRLVVQLPNDFVGSNNGELLPEAGGTLLYAGDGAISRIDPATGSVTPVVTGAPLETPLGLDWAQDGDLLIADSSAGAIFRWNEIDGISTVSDDSNGSLLVGPKRVHELADGDLFVLRVGRPLRIDSETGAQSLYSDTIGSVSSAAVASNGDLLFANTTSFSNAAVARLTSPTAQPTTLLVPGRDEPLLNVAYLALDSEDRILIAGTHQTITDGVVTDSDGSVWRFDPRDSSLTLLSRRPPPGGLATSADGRLYVANMGGLPPFNLSEVNPRTGEPRRVAQDALFSRPLDAAVEADGRVVVVNGTPNGIASVLRVDPETGETVPLSPTGELVDPEKIAVAPDGNLFVSDFQVGLVRIDPVTGAQSVVPDSGDLTFNDDLEVEPGGTLLVAEDGGERLIRVNPVTGARAEVGPLLDLIPVLAEPQGYSVTSALGLGLDATPYVSLLASSGPNGYALFSAPTDAADTLRVSELPLCRGDDLEVVKALPAPEPAGAAAAASVALVGLAARRRRSKAAHATATA